MTARQSNSPVSVLRKILGLTQAEFAKKLEVSKELIKSIENPDRPNKVSHELNKKLTMTFGVTGASVREDEGWPKDLEGNDYAYGSYLKFINGWQKYDEASPEVVAQIIEETIISRIRDSFLEVDKFGGAEFRKGTIGMLVKALSDVSDSGGAVGIDFESVLWELSQKLNTED